MRRGVAPIAFICVAALSCSRSPVSTATGPSPADRAVSPGASASQAADWACAARGAANLAGSPWRVEAPFCESESVRRVLSAATASPVFAPGPTNYRATVVGTTVRLEWDQSPGTFAWQIEAGSAAGQANLAVLRTAASTLGTAATQIFDIANVPAGRYFSRVRSGPPSFSDLSLPSNEIEIIVGAACGAAPTAPTGFSASVAGNDVNLNWVPPAGQTVSSYLLEVGSAAGFSNLLVFDTGSATTSLAATAANGTYFARLRSRNACGTSAPTSDVAIVIPGASPPPPMGCRVTTSPFSEYVPGVGGTVDIQVSINPGCAWRATSFDRFFTFPNGSLGQGAGLLRVAVAATPSGSRIGLIHVTSDENTAESYITQGRTCTYAVNPTTINVTAAGGDFLVTMSTQTGCPWAATSNSSFVSVLSGGSRSGSGSFTIRVDGNSTVSRNGSARVMWSSTVQDIIIAQAAPVANASQ